MYAFHGPDFQKSSILLGDQKPQPNISKQVAMTF